MHSKKENGETKVYFSIPTVGPESILPPKRLKHSKRHPSVDKPCFPPALRALIPSLSQHPHSRMSNPTLEFVREVFTVYLRGPLFLPIRMAHPHQGNLTLNTSQRISRTVTPFHLQKTTRLTPNLYCIWRGPCNSMLNYQHSRKRISYSMTWTRTSHLDLA